MLPKNQRLTTAAFDQYFKTGNRHHSTHLQVVYTPYPTFHASVVVGKKVYKLAVARNRLRRQLYAGLYQLSTQTEMAGVFVVLVKPAAKNIPGKLLVAELRELVGKTIKKR